MSCTSSRYLTRLQENTLYVGRMRGGPYKCSTSTLCSELGSQANPCQTLEEALNVITNRYVDAPSSSVAVMFQNGTYFVPEIIVLPDCIGYMGCSNGLAVLPDLDPTSILSLRLENVAVKKIMSIHSNNKKTWFFDKCEVNQIDLTDTIVDLDVQQSQLGNIRVHLSGDSTVHLQVSNSRIQEVFSSSNFLDLFMNDQSSLDIIIQNSTLDIKNKNQIFAELFGHARFRYIKTNVNRIERKSTYLLHDFSVVTKETSLNTTTHYYNEKVFEYKLHGDSIFNSTKTNNQYTTLDNPLLDDALRDEKDNILQDFQHFDRSNRSITVTGYSLDNLTKRIVYSIKQNHFSRLQGHYTNVNIKTKHQLSDHSMHDQSFCDTNCNNCQYECIEPQTMSQSLSATIMNDFSRKKSTYFNVTYASRGENLSVPLFSHQQKNFSRANASLINYSIHSNFSTINKITLYDNARLEMIKDVTKCTSENPQSQNSYTSFEDSQFKITENNGSHLKTLFYTDSDKSTVDLSNSAYKGLSIKGKFYVNLFGIRSEPLDEEIPLIMGGTQNANISSARFSAVNNHGLHLKDNTKVNVRNSIVNHLVHSDNSSTPLPLILSDANKSLVFESCSLTSLRDALIHIIGPNSICNFAHVAMSTASPEVVTGEGVLFTNPISTQLSSQVASTIKLFPNTTTLSQ